MLVRSFIPFSSCCEVGRSRPEGGPQFPSDLLVDRLEEALGVVGSLFVLFVELTIVFILILDVKSI